MTPHQRPSARGVTPTTPGQALRFFLGRRLSPPFQFTFPLRGTGRPHRGAQQMRLRLSQAGRSGREQARRSWGRGPPGEPERQSDQTASHATPLTNEGQPGPPPTAALTIEVNQHETISFPGERSSEIRNREEDLAQPPPRQEDGDTTMETAFHSSPPLPRRRRPRLHHPALPPAQTEPRRPARGEQAETRSGYAGRATGRHRHHRHRHGDAPDDDAEGLESRPRTAVGR